MSYILDALRKADAERDRGNVPGIHAQPSFGGSVPMRAPPAAKPWLWLAASALAAGLVAAVAWYAMSPLPAAVVATPPVSAPLPITFAPAPVAPVPVAAPPTQAAARKPEAAIGERKPKPKPLPAPEPVATAVDAKPAATGEKVYTLAELPDEIRRQLPAINVGGSMYSAKPADRVLIINGQVLHEGDRIAPDLALQQIRSRGALLSFKGYRYTITY